MASKGDTRGIEMSKVAKGYRGEKICADYYKTRGYLIWKTIRHRFLNIDLFGLFDVVALAPDGSELVFIQVKTGYCDSATLKSIAELKMPSGCKKAIWDNRRNGIGFRVREYKNGEYIVIDENRFS
jgi:Holliday junction resolvase-like predicted endonuclease